MKKIIMSMLAILLVGMSFATAISIRGDNGIVSSIGSDTVFSFKDVHFSAWNNDGQGQSSLSLVAKGSKTYKIYGNYA